MIYGDDVNTRPTLANTMRQIGVVSWAIWTDYREFNRLAKRHQRVSRRFALSPTRWQEDRCLVAVAGVVVIGVAALALYMAGAWGPLFALLGVA